MYTCHFSSAIILYPPPCHGGAHHRSLSPVAVDPESSPTPDHNGTSPRSPACVAAQLTNHQTRQTFTRYVQAGRIALVNYGEHLNKLVVIVDILDQNRVLVEGPTCALRRQVMNVKRLALTNILLEGITRGDDTKKVADAYKSADVDGKFAASAWGQKLARSEKRRNLDDFGRFKVMVARMKKSKAVNAELAKLTA